jgi:hypothetical protein
MVIDANKAEVAARLYAWAQDWASRRQPFDWGRSNCCHLVSSWVEHVEGVDHLARLEQTPDARSAVRLVARYGGLDRAVSHAMQREPVTADEARMGDVVLVPPERGAPGGGLVGLLGISCGALIMVRAGDSMTLMPACMASLAWMVVWG